MLVEGFVTRDLSGTLRLGYPAEGASHEIEFPVGEEGVGTCGGAGDGKR